VVVVLAADDFDGHAGAGGEVVAEQFGGGGGAEGVDVVEEEIVEGGLFGEEGGESAVAEEIGDFVPVADGVDALGG
jgi:hypothetical protein